MKCLMELDNHFGLTWAEKLAYLTYRFSKLPQKGTPVAQWLEHGYYVREIYVPAETLFVGRPHRHGHRIELVQGKLLHVEEHRKVHVEAPFTMHSTPGYQTVFYTKTDILGRTYHHVNPNCETDFEQLEAEAFLPVNDLIIKGAIVRDRIRALEAQRQQPKMLEAV